jgi:hypothetical protein
MLDGVATRSETALEKMRRVHELERSLTIEQ